MQFLLEEGLDANDVLGKRASDDVGLGKQSAGRCIIVYTLAQFKYMIPEILYKALTSSTISTRFRAL